MKPFVVSNADKTKLCAALVRILQSGKQNAITGKNLARRLYEPDDRRIRVAIRELIAQGVAVASSVTEPMGYYIVSNDDEAAEYLRILDNRIREDKARRDDFAEVCAQRGMNIPTQGGLL